MTEAAHPTWQNFESYYLGGPPREVVLPGASRLTLFVSPEDQTFGMRLPANAREELPRNTVESIRIRAVRMRGQPLCEISCVPQARNKEFFYFLLAIADSIQLKSMRIAEAYDAALLAWKGLLRSETRMSEEEELGLFGELLTLQQLITLLGPTAVEHWVGSTGDRHDFRVGSLELEVKTTRASRRTHLINGLDQLQSSRNCTLFIVSWQLEASGADAGSTLTQLIHQVRGDLGVSPGCFKPFDALLAKRTAHYELDPDVFLDRWRPRNQPRLISVDSDCPRITPPILESGLPRRLVALVSELHYRINLEGRGSVLDQRALLGLLKGRYA